MLNIDQPLPRSFMFCTSFIGSETQSKFRYDKWLGYYVSRMKKFGVERVFLIDDGSALENIPHGVIVIDADDTLPATLPSGTLMFRFRDNYGRSSVSVYPGWWRSFTYAAVLAKKYAFEKIIHCESDAYVISNRMAEYMNGFNGIWGTFWCPRWQFPESALQLISGRAIDALGKYHLVGKKVWSEDRGPSGFAEHILPFTEVNKSFVGDRYGEYMPDFPRNADYVCQCNPTMNVEEFLL